MTTSAEKQKVLKKYKREYEFYSVLPSFMKLPIYEYVGEPSMHATQSGSCDKKLEDSEFKVALPPSLAEFIGERDYILLTEDYREYKVHVDPNDLRKTVYAIVRRWYKTMSKYCEYIGEEFILVEKILTDVMISPEKGTIRIKLEAPEDEDD